MWSCQSQLPAGSATFSFPASRSFGNMTIIGNSCMSTTLIISGIVPSCAWTLSHKFLSVELTSNVSKATSLHKRSLNSRFIAKFEGSRIRRASRPGRWKMMAYSRYERDISPRGLFAQRNFTNEVSQRVAEDGNEEFRRKRRLSQR